MINGLRPNPTTTDLPKEMTGLNLKLGNTEPVPEEETIRSERKALKKAQAKKEIAAESEDDESEDDDDDLLNPQKATQKRQTEKAKAKTATKPVLPEMSRKDK